MPLQATSGAASYDAFGGGVAAVPNYIEDVFSTYLYTGNGSTQTITNGIDLSTKGGLVWYKDRTTAYEHQLVDTIRGAGYNLETPNTSAQASRPTALTAFTSTGFTLGSNGAANGSGDNFVSWSFRDQPKFKAQLTYTGNGGTLSVSHSLGSKPGCIIIKKTSGAGDWLVITRKSDGNIYAMYLNQTAGQFYDGTEGSLWTSTSVSINWINSNVAGGFNDSGSTYVMYLLAHNAGGFGLTGTDNVISCGSFTTNGSGIIPTVDLGYEPQWVLAKPSSGTGNWFIMDNMRGWYNQQADQGNALFPNTSGAEAAGYNAMIPTATGFTGPSVNFGAGITYIYIAIRRGPMKVPTSGTSVFSPEIGLNAASNGLAFDSGFVSDFLIRKYRPGTSNIPAVSRLTGDKGLYTTTTGAEYTETYASKWDSMLGVLTGTSADFSEQIGWVFKRAPSTFDEVCFTPTGVAQTITHNLGVAPELIIGKTRDAAFNWYVYAAPLGNTQALYLNTTDTPVSGQYLWNNTSPTASVFSVGTGGINTSAATKSVAYLWATNAGVTKVGSYTGNGSSQTINCGFTSGSRMVLIIRTDASGDRYIWDSARGIVSGNDPHLSLNSTAAEVTTDDTIDTDSTGFIVNQVSATNCNVNGASYIFLSYA